MTTTHHDVTRTDVTAPTPDAELVSMGQVFSPATDIFETKDSVRLISDLPSVEEKDLHVTLENRVLTIEARQGSVAPEGVPVLVAGTTPRTFRRTFRINTPVDHAGVKARLSRAVLHLTLPIAPEARPRRIQVEAG